MPKEIENKLNNSELQCSLKEEELDYNTLFNSKVYSMVTSGKTSELIEEYEKKYSELLEKSLYMQKGVIDHNNYANISDSLGNNGFFWGKNEIRLVAKDGSTWVTASKNAVAYFMDPRNFLNDTYVFMFENLAYDAANQTQAGVEAILTGSFMANTNIAYLDANGTYIPTAESYSSKILQGGRCTATYV